MFDAETDRILADLRARGVRLKPDGDRIEIRPASKVPPDLLEAIRRHKPEIMARLIARGVRAELRPWVHIARQVIAGEFDGGSVSLLDSLAIGLEYVPDPLRGRSLERIARLKEKAKRDQESHTAKRRRKGEA